MTTTLIWTNPELAQSQTNCTYDIPTITLWAAFIEQTIQNELDANGLPVNPPLPGMPGYIVGSGSGQLIEVAQHWICRDIRVQQKHDGTIPNDLKEGTMGVSVTIDTSITFYDDKGRDALNKYILSQVGDEENDDSQYAGLLALAGEDL